MNRKNVSISTGGEFAEQILAEFIAEGFSGEGLLAEFKIRQAKVRSAVEGMIAEAKDVAQGKGEYSSYEDIFCMEDDETSQPPSLV